MKINFTTTRKIGKTNSIIMAVAAMMLISISATADDPEVISVSPADGASGVSVSTQVVVLFSENMNAATINSSTFELRANGNNVIAASISYDAALRKATLTPLASLANSTSYKVTVVGGKSGVKDVTGKKMKGNFQSSFTTIAAPDITPPVVKNVEPGNGATGVSLATEVSVKFSEDMNSGSITTVTFELRDGANQIVPSTVSYHAPSRKATLRPLSILVNSNVYTARVTGGVSGVKDLAGNALVNDYSWSFSTPYTIFQPTAEPATPVITDQPVEVGVKFTTTQNGQITGLRFYKGAGNDGVHTGHLWNNTGNMLAEATFSNESASGWQQVLFAAPVSIVAGQVYTASYFSSLGKYGFTNSYFTTTVVNGPIRALADGESGGNGVYAYSAGPAFPTSTFNGTNYFVDVVFIPNPNNNRLYVANNIDRSPAATSPASTNTKNSLPVGLAAKSRGGMNLFLEVKTAPNPSVNYFSLFINSNDANPVTIRVLDMSGSLIYEKLTSGGVVRIGQAWKSGIYFAEIMQGDQRKVVKLVKAN